jgi:hypothetical protein
VLNQNLDSVSDSFDEFGRFEEPKTESLQEPSTILEPANLSDAKSMSVNDDDFGNFDGPLPENQPETTPTKALDQSDDAEDSFDDFGNFDGP